MVPGITLSLGSMTQYLFPFNIVGPRWFCNPVCLINSPNFDISLSKVSFGRVRANRCI